jgi:nucleotide-binding universal stress UspA family protein
VVLVRAVAGGAAAERAIRHVLIPLDGSTLAEQALDPALELAQRSGARVTLLRVVHLAPLMAEGFGSPIQPPMPLDSTLQQRERQAREYLNRLAWKIQPRVTQIESKVVVAEGADASEILEFARDHDVDLIALATHGRSGLKRLLLGSVADKVIRRADTPVLVIRPRE